MRSCRQVHQEFHEFVPRTHVTVWTCSTFKELPQIGDGYEFIAAPMENAYLRSHIKVLRLNLLRDLYCTSTRPEVWFLYKEGCPSWVLALPHTFPALETIQIMVYIKRREDLRHPDVRYDSYSDTAKLRHF